MVKALKVTPRVSKANVPGITPRNNNPRSASKTARPSKVAEVKFHVKRQK